MGQIRCGKATTLKKEKMGLKYGRLRGTLIKNGAKMGATLSQLKTNLFCRYSV